MSSQAHVLKVWYSAWCYWEMEEHLRNGFQWEASGHWGCSLEGYSRTPDSSSFSVLPGYQKMKGFFCKALLP